MDEISEEVDPRLTYEESRTDLSGASFGFLN